MASITRITKVWQKGATVPSPPIRPSRPAFSEVSVHTRCLPSSPVNTLEDLKPAREGDQPAEADGSSTVLGTGGKASLLSPRPGGQPAVTLRSSSREHSPGEGV